MLNPKVSILMPVKNTDAYLEECIHSIIAQTFQQWQLIAIDDHSEDRSPEILNFFSEKDQRIKTFKNTGKGIIEALRLAYQHANGTYITRMDSDDIMAPTKIEQLQKKLSIAGKRHVSIGLVRYFSANKMGQGYSNYANWLNDLTSSETNFQDIYKECTIPSPSWMIHRDDLEHVGAFSPDTYPEDYDLAFRFLKAKYTIVSVKETLHHWRDYQTRTSRTDSNYADNQFTHLKVNYFIEIDYNPTKELILWGAGKKGKKVAHLLIEKGIHFTWTCNNNNKIGRDIYGKILLDSDTIETRSNIQVIVAVSSEHDNVRINELIAKKNNEAFFRFS